MKIKWMHSLLFAIAASTILPCSISAAAPPKTEWLFMQHQLHKGDIKTYICHDAVHIINLAGHYEVIAKAPDWTVCCFRKDENLIWKIPLDKFRGLDLSSFMGPERKQLILTKTGDGQISGINAHTYIVGSPGKRKVTLACASDMDIARQTLDALSIYFKTPLTSEMPLELHEVDTTKGEQPPAEPSWLDRQRWREDLSKPHVARPFITISRTKVPYRKEDFVVPAGLTPVQRYQSIVFSRTQKDQIDIVIPDIGFAGDYSNNKKKK